MMSGRAHTSATWVLSLPGAEGRKLRLENLRATTLCAEVFSCSAEAGPRGHPQSAAG